jgi:hypothetical protein
VMQAAIIGLASVFAVGLVACHRAPGSLSLSPKTFAPAAVISLPKKPDFATEIKPIFQTRCQPCHFAGGQVYDRMPFDKPETITRLGTKLFTRIKDEKERHLIREFLTP